MNKPNISRMTDSLKAYTQDCTSAMLATDFEALAASEGLLSKEDVSKYIPKYIIDVVTE